VGCWGEAEARIGVLENRALEIGSTLVAGDLDPQ